MGRDVSRVAEITAIAEPIAAERGLEILDIEIGGTAGNPVIRVLLDSPDEARRVATDDCQAVSHRLGDGLDAHEVLGGRYMLEVSSPGVNRPLKKIEHFRRVLGSKVKVRARTADGARRTWTGRLEEVGDDAITVADETLGTARIALVDVDKANLEFEFGKPAKPKGRKG